ncbi:MAG: TrmO family methyltransferase [Bacteroidota bacterium]
MEHRMQINPIGHIHAAGGNFYIQLSKDYRAGLTNIEGFSHLQVVWWGSLFDQPEHRRQLVNGQVYKHSPEHQGVFATRSQFRPNPILITNIFVESIDREQGIIRTPYLDAEDGTPVLDIKPYHRYERVRDCRVPTWCDHWPQWHEEAATFNWEAEFNF